MAREQRPISSDQIPEEARLYLAAIEQYQDHPFVQRHFFQVTRLSLMVPNHGRLDFFALEFRIGQQAALIWQDAQGNWGAGRWVRLSHLDADITCPPSPISLEYFQGAKANPTLGSVLELLAASNLLESDSSGVGTIVAFLYGQPDAADEEIHRHLTEQGFSQSQATKLIQFIPIVFTRFLYRNAGIQFAPNYVLLDLNGQPIAQRPIAEEPAFREAWAYCEQSSTRGVNEEYFRIIAARSGGYRAIQDLLQQGLDLAGIVTSPPMMME
jgi:hypothetical protein